jgi:transcriptional antiterminator Rof (Rho-off)
MSESYRPISCALHDTLESAIVRRRRLSVRWRDAEGMQHHATVSPLDVFARDGVEYLRFRDVSGGTQDVRLDFLHDWRETD